MPEHGVQWLPKQEILSFQQIAFVVETCTRLLNIRRFKLTGGEPTVRSGFVDLVGRLASIPGVEDLSLTTNGFLLDELAQPLRTAGLHRLTVSVDSLDPARFRSITRTGDLRRVLDGIDRALDAGFTSVKINCVTMRGTNDDELVNFAKLTIDRPVTVRFIEYMPLGDAALLHSSAKPAVIDTSERGPAGGCGAQDRGGDAFISETQVRSIIEHELGPLEPVDRSSEAGVGPAVPYQLSRHNPRGRVAFISAMSAPFCDTCNRLRLTANGVLRSCLFEGGEVDLRTILTSDLPADVQAQQVARAMRQCVLLKPDVHSARGHDPMSRIGG